MLSLCEDGCEAVCGFLRLNNTADPRAAIRQARREEREEDRRRDREIKRRNQEETFRLTQALNTRRLERAAAAADDEESKPATKTSWLGKSKKVPAAVRFYRHLLYLLLYLKGQPLLDDPVKIVPTHRETKKTKAVPSGPRDSAIASNSASNDPFAHTWK